MNAKAKIAQEPHIGRYSAKNRYVPSPPTVVALLAPSPPRRPAVSATPLHASMLTHVGHAVAKYAPQRPTPSVDAVHPTDDVIVDNTDDAGEVNNAEPQGLVNVTDDTTSSPGLRPRPKRTRARRPSPDEETLPRLRSSDFNNQVRNGASPAMIDYLGVRFRVVNRATGELLDPKRFLATLLTPQRRLASACPGIQEDKERYKIKLTPTCTVTAYAYHDTLVVTGNPNKVHRAWNEFADQAPDRAVARYMAAITKALCTLYGASLSFSDAFITRIDITQMLWCGSCDVRHDTHGHMRMHLRLLNTSGTTRNASVHSNTIMVGEPDDGYQIRSYSVSGKANPTIHRDEDRHLRLELVLHPKRLQWLVRKGLWTPHDLNAMLQLSLKDVRETYNQWRPARTQHPPRSLPRELVPAWAVWICGVDLRTIPQYRDNFRQLAKQFLEHGIDLNEPPSPRGAESSKALKLTELLDPKRYDANGRRSAPRIRALIQASTQHQALPQAVAAA